MSITLTHLTGPDAGIPQSLPADRVVLGRHPDCDMVFGSEAHAMVGTRHAEILQDGTGGYILRDLNSRNGTFVNGEPISGSVRLTQGASVQLGRGGPELRFSSQTPRSATAGSGARVQELVVEHVAGSLAGRSQTFTAPRIQFGRDTGCDVRFDPNADRRASSRHAELRLDNGRYVLEDLGSSNGTFVNGERVRQRVLEPGDLVQFGDGGPQVRISLPNAGAQLGARTMAAPAAPAKQGPGENTVRVMVDQAVEKARQNPGTQWVRKVVGEATHESKKTTQRYASVGLALLVIASGGILAKSRFDQQALRTDLVDHVGGVQSLLQNQLVSTQTSIRGLETRVAGAATQEELAQLNSLLEVERGRATNIEQQLASTRTQLAATDARAVQAMRGFRDAAAGIEAGIYMLAIQYPTYGETQGYCSAFAVREDGLLLSNAHCQEAMVEQIEAAAMWDIPAIPVAIRNREPETALEIVASEVHPDYYFDGIDIAYMRVATDGPLPGVLPIASEAELDNLGPGYEVAVFGYPGEIMDASEPSATFLPGTIGRLTAGGNQIQHSSLTSGGTSGSPIINRNGEVVAINHAGWNHNIMTLDTDSFGQVRFDNAGAPLMRPLAIPRAGLAYGIHGRHIVSWLQTVQ